MNLNPGLHKHERAKHRVQGLFILHPAEYKRHT